MSLYQTNLSKFIYILQTKPHLLSAEDWISLEELLAKVSGDIKELSNAIITWRNHRPEIKDAMRKLPKKEADDKAPKDQPTNPPQDYKEMIENEIRQHKTSSNPSPEPEPEK